MAEQDLQYGRWYDVTGGGRVLRRPGDWWTVETLDGKHESGCGYSGFHTSIVNFTEAAARILARAVGGVPVKLDPIRYKGKTYESDRWVVRFGLGVEGEMAMLSDEVGGFDD